MSGWQEPQFSASENANTDPFEPARAVAEAVLHEGYLLYPYRASAPKNQIRWQFGVLVPPAWSEADCSEHTYNQTELLLEPTGPGVGAVGLRVQVRFLQVEAKTVEESHENGYRPVSCLVHEGSEVLSWDHGIDRQVDIAVSLAELQDADKIAGFTMPSQTSQEILRNQDGRVAGRVTRETYALSGQVHISARPLETAPELIKVSIQVENLTAPSAPLGSRGEALRYSLVATHTMIALQGGAFVSLLDPPDSAQPAVESCVNLRTWPVLMGEETSQTGQGRRDVMLSSPIVLYDYPRISPESKGDFFDATEIDELLTLRTMTMTEEEKKEARATDPRSAEILDRVDTITAEGLSRLHGAVRSADGTPVNVREPASLPWWTPEAEATISPETDVTVVDGVEVSNGSRVRLHPKKGRGDVQDMFLEGCLAIVHGVFLDVDENPHLAVIVEDDPAAELLQWNRRYLYFSPDEVEPVDPKE